MKKNIIKTRVFPSSGRDLSMMVTNLLMLGTRFTDLSGLSTLRALSPLNFILLSLFRKVTRNSKILERTTVKSTIFHPSRKYEFLCFINP